MEGDEHNLEEVKSLFYKLNFEKQRRLLCMWEANFTLDRNDDYDLEFGYFKNNYSDIKINSALMNIYKILNRYCRCPNENIFLKYRKHIII